MEAGQGWGSSWSDENVLKLVVVTVAQLGYTKNRRILYLKWVNCMACEFFSKRAVLQMKKKAITGSKCICIFIVIDATRLLPRGAVALPTSSSTE